MIRLALKTLGGACLWLILSCDPQPKRLIIDADTANEVDDLFALVGAIAHTEGVNHHNLLGITSAQFHTSPLATDNSVGESQRINEDLVRLMNRPEIKTPLGSNVPLDSAVEPRISDASTFLVVAAHDNPNPPLDIFILGSCTNVASAILQDPTIIPKVRVHYLGFWHDPETNTYDKKEFNSGNDTLAINVLLDAERLDFRVMTATTSQHLVFDRGSVETRLADAGAIGAYLLDRWGNYDRWWTDEDPEKQQWIMWDVALLEAYFRPENATLKRLNTPAENTRRLIGVYTDINAEKMERAYWRTVLGR